MRKITTLVLKNYFNAHLPHLALCLFLGYGVGEGQTAPQDNRNVVTQWLLCHLQTLKSFI